MPDLKNQYKNSNVRFSDVFRTQPVNSLPVEERGLYFMRTINKEELVEAIARRGNMFTKDVEKFLALYDDVIFSLLSEPTGVEEGLKIRIANGIYIERKFVPERVQEFGQLAGKTIPEHCNLRGHITPYYADKMNEAIKK